MANGKRGAPLGNTNGVKNKPWREAIDRAIKQANLEQADLNKALPKASRKPADVLRRIADRMLVAAEEGDAGARHELGDRLDGKAVQPLAAFDGGELKVVLQQADADA